MPDTTMTDRDWRLDTIEDPAASSGMNAASDITASRVMDTIDPARAQTAAKSKRAPARFVRRWNRAVRTWARARLNRLGVQTARFEAVLHEFTGVIETADNAGAVKSALLRQAQRIVPAYRVELISEAASQNHNAPLVSTDVPCSGGGGNPSRPINDQNGKSILEVPIRCGAAAGGRLRIRPRARGVIWLKQETIRRLTTLCTLGACAIERLDHHAGWPEHDALSQPGDSAGADSGASAACTTLQGATRLHDATYLNAVLPFALSQARRHNEPLSIVCVAIDRLGGIQDLLGRAAVDQLVESVGETVAALIRASDIVARLDDDRVVAMLPRAPGGGAMHVARKICNVVAEKSHDDCQISKVTLSIGVATFPSCADNVFSLFDAADLALARAQSEGRNQACLAPRRPAPALVPNQSGSYASAHVSN